MTLVLAVIHHRDYETSLDNAAIAEDAGCAGVILIQMDGHSHLIDAAAQRIKERNTGLLVGANRLEVDPWTAIRRDHALGLDATWADEPGVTSKGADPDVEYIREALVDVRKRNKDFMFFGSVAFKTQAPERDPAGAARIAAAEPWIVTTSGKATGSAPSEEKLAVMAGAIGAQRLAVASGIDPENARVLAPHVGWVLAATGISRSFYEFDPALTKSLVMACRYHGHPMPS